MLTKSPTEQGIWRALVFHVERQKGLWSSEGVSFMWLKSGD